MSLTQTSTAPSASSSSCSTADFTRFPSADIACAVGSISGLPSNTTDVMSKCCKSAPVEAFNGDCGHYCLSVQQSVADLQKCFMEGGVGPSNIFCNGQQTQTATGTPSRTGGSASKTDGANASTGAAPGLVVQGVSKMGMGALGMLVVSFFAGAML
ncbi:hypothetical protein HBI56_144550 [Parastagonospora nodorum]|uniref:Uncharacterized protein n=2 Tax=Phaeosphaeria nodorum (strain SN15 / ATCC MYA-4574 / FGSC 10173) TaxID=321614 RepID=Q0UM24_PHANO|nr:hypothetical protein SNOG_07190 [Parastagonospora nodorum SN15]KAH3918149.1 hypothetical protein HBH56_032470 [Parastagonospora nodorum]EAT85841.1 hypothetical protein SNOG_07190 [Parastagonospora nodorum SN15]KAH3933565.1 hypothetical protein HBH54_066970 [Parastagonospora nodorum]KAH3979556.1 hypothetical protein HBH51_054100 [Parastagonospora nodorum]KAH4047371.1 hypothetical protein HBH49_173270 [Parastagonospora nodorum]